jgi:plastocyanin
VRATVVFLTALIASLATTTPSAADPLAAVDAQMVEGTDTSQWGYTPNAVSLVVGQSLSWTNIGVTPHTATEDSDKWDTGLLLPGAAASVSFNAAGTYTYHCSLHPWMKGAVVVASVDPEDPGRTDTQAVGEPD